MMITVLASAIQIVCRRSFITSVFILHIVACASAQTLIPAIDDYVADDGSVLDAASELRINSECKEIFKETGYKIFVATVRPDFCNFSPTDADVILESYTKEVTDKSLLLYVCLDSTQVFHFQYAIGKHWEPALNKIFFVKLETFMIAPYANRMMYGEAMYESVVMIRDLQFQGTSPDFESIILAQVEQQGVASSSQSEETVAPKFGKSEESDVAIRVFLFCLFSAILGIGFAYAVRTRGVAAWFMFIFMIPFWVFFYSVVFEDYGPYMALLYIVSFLFVRRIVVSRGWWFSHDTVISNRGAVPPPPAFVGEARRRVMPKGRFQGRGSKGGWEQDYE